MRGFRCFRIVQLDFPGSCVWCIRVRLSPMRINDLDLGASKLRSLGGSKAMNDPYIVVVIFQITSKGDFPTDGAIVSRNRPLTPIYRIDRPWRHIIAIRRDLHIAIVVCRTRAGDNLAQKVPRGPDIC